MERVISYAQNREDILIANFFKNHKGPGFYVDIGANYPTEDSVTKYFYDKGWRGINIEPNPELHEMLQKERKRDINLCIGISDKKQNLVLRQYAAHGLATFSGELKKGYSKLSHEYLKDYIEYEVPTDTLSNVLTKHKAKVINFLKVDVEGFEYNVLKANDWKKFRPQVLCIEANHIGKDDWRPILKRAKYSLVFFDGLNEYYVANECKNMAKEFSYVDAALPANKVVNFYIDNEIKHLQRIIDEKQKYIKTLESNTRLQHKRIDELSKMVASSKIYRLAKLSVHPGQLAKKIDGYKNRGRKK